MTPIRHTAPLVTALAAAAVLVPAVPASAEPAAKLALFAVADVWVKSTTATSATVCAEGWVDDGVPIVGYWSFRVVGNTTTYTASRGGPAFPEDCHAVATNGTPAGFADASVVYLGVNGDVLASCTLLIRWSPLTPYPDGVLGACTAMPPAPAPIP